jgi:hypothetical protein
MKLGVQLPSGKPQRSSLPRHTGTIFPCAYDPSRAAQPWPESIRVPRRHPRAQGVGTAKGRRGILINVCIGTRASD